MEKVDAAKPPGGDGTAPGGQDSVDFKGSSCLPQQMGTLGITSDPGVLRPDPLKGETGFTYNMNYPQRGYAIIINNKKFHPRTGMKERKGSDIDAASLKIRLSALGFDVDLLHNQTVTEMLKATVNMSKKDHSECDCFVLAILSHGDEGLVYGVDSIIKLDTILEPLKGDRCKSLVGKPKLFFIQACRGSKFDEGAEVADADNPEEGQSQNAQRVPTEADILMAFSTVPGYYSWRNSTKGSWFIQSLCRVLDQYGSSKEIMWIMTRVNHMVAYEFESNASQAFLDKKKQIPCIMTMLTKELYFYPKKE